MGINLVPGTGSRRAYFPKYRIAQGPWTGGINTVEKASNLNENELQDCVNYIIKPDGTLKTRPTAVDIGNLGFLVLPSADYPVNALGSIVREDGTLVPVISFRDNGLLAPGDGTCYFRYWDGTDWTDAFESLPEVDAFIIRAFYKVIRYNDIYWALSSDGLWYTSSLTDALNFIEIDAIDEIPVLGIDMMIFKNRLFIHDGVHVFYSKATDPATWTTPDAGVILLEQQIGDTIRKMIEFQDAIWLMSNSGIFRISFTTDPSTDGVVEQVSSQGAFDAIVYNNEMYIINGTGVYKLVANYFVEVSAKIRNLFKIATTNFSFIEDQTRFGYANLRKAGLFTLGSLLLCGPFNEIVTRRFLEPDDAIEGIGNGYFVMDLDTGSWTKFQFSAYSTTNPISGPVQDIMPVAVNSDPAAPEDYIWVGASLAADGHTLPFAQTISIMSVAQLATSLSELTGLDYGTDGVEWIGGKIKLGSVALGDSTQWKRVFTATLKAIHNSPEVLPNVGVMGYDIDGKPSDITPIDAQVGRIKLGKAFRAHEYAFYYDSITGLYIDPETDVDDAEPEITEIQEFNSYVQVSRKTESVDAPN